MLLQLFFWLLDIYIYFHHLYYYYYILYIYSIWTLNHGHYPYKWLWIYGRDNFLKLKAHKKVHRRMPTTYYYLHFVSPCVQGSYTCDEHPKKMTVAQSANPRLDVPSEVRSLQRQHSTLEISPLITIITRWLVQLGLVWSAIRLLVGRSWCLCELLQCFVYVVRDLWKSSLRD